MQSNTDAIIADPVFKVQFQPTKVPINSQGVYEHEVQQKPNIDGAVKTKQEEGKEGEKKTSTETKPAGTGAQTTGKTMNPAVVEKKVDGEVGKSGEKDAVNESRRQAVVQAFKHGFEAYRRHCPDGDELNPISKSCRNWLHLGLTRLDALDTMWLMDMKEEFQESVSWLDKHFYLDKNVRVSLFEAMIRIVGGLLSAFDLSKDPSLLDKAKKFADRLMPAFSKHETGYPDPVINLETGASEGHQWTGGRVVLSEIGTVQLELAYLSHHTGDPKYAKAGLKILKVLREKASITPGLYSTYLRPGDGSGTDRTGTLNAPGDSMYEYLLKLWLLTGKKISWLGAMWKETADAILNKLKTTSGDHVFAGTWSAGRVSHNVEQLSCFGGGLMALSSKHETDEATSKEQLQFGADFTKFCRAMYTSFRSGLAPESVTVSGGRLISGPDTFALRPETVESIFYLWRSTKNPMYREWAWEIFQSIEKHCKVPTGGYSGIKGTDSDSPRQDDIQHSWFFAETLKYLFLTFSDDSVLPLDKYVLNTEAHPLSVFTLDPSIYSD